MIFNTFGDINKPPIVIMHGMCQDWTPMYKFMKPLEEKYYLIIPAMDGFYKDSGEFTSFEDQSRQIEEYVIKNHDGKLYGFYGVSQGGLMGCELLARNKINVEKAFLDGTYIAHQGRIAGVLSAKTL